MADLIVLAHFAFVLFVVCGAAAVLRWRWVVWLHIPAVLWAALIEFSGWMCPLTPLENRFRRQHGESTYDVDFIAHYILPLLYPEGLTRRHQVWLGALALTVNVTLYAFIFLRHRRSVAEDI
jgi:hypothetical protein